MARTCSKSSGVKCSPAVGAAADGDLFRGQAGLLDGLAGRLHKVEVGLDFLQHIAVAVLDLDFHRAGAVLAVEVAGDVEKVVLLELQLAGVVVAEDVAQLCLGDVAVHLAQMVEALIALGGLLSLIHISEPTRH